MKRTRTPFLAALLVLALAACRIRELEDCSCMQNVELTFRYHETPGKEAMPDYVGSMTHLLFRNDTLVGRLAVNGHVEGEGLLNPAAGLLSDGSQRNLYTLRTLRFNLPAGTYSLYSWGNYLEGTSLFEEHGTPPQIAQSLRNDLSLHHIKASPANHGTLDNSERLYFGSHTFSVTRTRRYSHTIDLLNAHMVLSVMVVWEGVAPPANLRDLRLRLSDTPTGYAQQVTDTLPMTLTAPQPAYGPREAAEHVPAWDGDAGTLSAPVTPLETNKVWSQLIAYRLRDENHPILSMWDGEGSTQILKNLDLGRFFETIGWARTRNRRQEYDLLITLRAGGEVTIEPLGVIPWMDGGTITVKR